MILELLQKRGSVRKYTTDKIPSNVVDDILEAGRLSPSGGNEQPWKFGVINKTSLIKEISKIAYNQKWIAKAKLLIVLCTTLVDEEGGGRDIQLARFPEIEEKIKNMDRVIYSKLNQEEHQTKIPGSHMVLAALEHGVASTWVSKFKVNELSQLLNIPDGYIPAEIIAFGYPKNDIKSMKKKSIDEIVFYNGKFE